MKKTMMFATIAALAVSVNAADWFNADIGNIASWPAAGWSNTSDTTLGGTAPNKYLEFDIDQSPLTYTATSSKQVAQSANREIVFTSTVTFDSAYTTDPAIPDGSKLGVIVKSVNSVNKLAFLGLVNSELAWNVSDITVADLEAPVTLKITIAKNGANTEATYEVGSSTATYTIANDPIFQYVEFRGTGKCSALSATYTPNDPAGQIGTTVYYTMTDAFQAAGASDVIELLMNITADAVLPQGKTCKVQHGSYTMTPTTVTGYMVTKAIDGAITAYTSTAKNTSDITIADSEIPVSQEFLTASSISTSEGMNSSTKAANGLTPVQAYLIGLPSATADFKPAVAGTTASNITLGLGEMNIPVGSDATFALVTDGTEGSYGAASDFTITKTAGCHKYTIKAKLGDDKFASALTVGVQQVTKTAGAPKYVPVQWQGFAGENIKLTDIVDTAELANGDSIEAWDPASNNYLSYLWNGSAWAFAAKPGQQAPAAEPTLVRGLAVKLNCAAATAYTIGKDGGSVASTALVAGKQNLIANPTGEAFDISGKIGTADKVRLIPAGSQLPTATYRYLSGAWRKILPGVPAELSSTIPAGDGCFLENNSNAASIAW